MQKGLFEPICNARTRNIAALRVLNSLCIRTYIGISAFCPLNLGCTVLQLVRSAPVERV